MKHITLLTAALLFPAWASRAERTIGRIVGGTPARPGEFPFAAAITIQTSSERFFCGGAVYSPRFVLTAGHCVAGGVLFTVKLGSVRLDYDNGLYTATNTTSQYILHPDYNPSTLENDLGFVVFRSSILNIASIWYVDGLPEQSLGPGERVLAMGWGQVNDSPESPVNTLSYVPMTTISNEECQITYGSQITKDMVCAAGVTNEGTCVGDSGGPLVQPMPWGQMRLVGVSIFVSAKGCDGKNPSGFVRALNYWDWMYNVTERIP